MSLANERHTPVDMPDSIQTSAQPVLTLTLDITDLEAATSFWTSALVGEVVHRDMPGTMGEQRLLRFADAPALSLRLRWCWPRATVGTTPGGVREMEIIVVDPCAVHERIATCVGVSVTHEPDEHGSPLKLVDSQGYAIVFRAYDE